MGWLSSAVGQMLKSPQSTCGAAGSWHSSHSASASSQASLRPKSSCCSVLPLGTYTVVKVIPSTSTDSNRDPISSWPGSPCCTTVAGDFDSTATPFQLRCPKVAAW